VAAFVAGFALPYALVFGVYAAAGHLSEFLYYYQRYGREVYMAPVTWKVVRESLHGQFGRYSFAVSTAALALVLAVARLVHAMASAWSRAADAGRWARVIDLSRRNAPAVFILLHFLCSFFGATFLFRFYGHYYLELYPFLGLVAGFALRPGGDEARGPSGFDVALALAGMSALLLVADWSLRRNVIWHRGDARWDRWYQDPATDPIVRYVSSTTSPTDTIFVWGFRSETHVSAHRLPASRFVYSVYPSGFVPWFRESIAEEASRVVPGSQELLLSDLEEARPELVIDAGASMDDRYMHDIPIFHRYLEQRYCPMGTVDGEPVYRRRRGDTCPPPDATP
jgi:hypothetical protein